jgi:hypothetical protein
VPGGADRLIDVPRVDVNAPQPALPGDHHGVTHQGESPPQPGHGGQRARRGGQQVADLVLVRITSGLPDGHLDARVHRHDGRRRELRHPPGERMHQRGKHGKQAAAAGVDHAGLCEDVEPERRPGQLAGRAPHRGEGHLPDVGCGRRRAWRRTCGVGGGPGHGQYRPLHGLGDGRVPELRRLLQAPGQLGRPGGGPPGERHREAV